MILCFLTRSVFALANELVSVDPLVEALRSCGSGKIVAITGRNAPQQLLDIADTATEMRMLTHGYQQGIMAQKGVEN